VRSTFGAMITKGDAFASGGFKRQSKRGLDSANNEARRKAKAQIVREESIWRRHTYIARRGGKERKRHPCPFSHSTINNKSP
jgi:hypothetical protein